MVAFLIDDDPELAHQHALSANRRAGRIPVARETLAITAYRTGDFALALRELRTYRRLSGLDGHVSLMVDCERGLGRPDKAIETGLDVDASQLDTEQRVHLAIAMSGARLDLGQTQQALFELEIPELNASKAFSWSPDLFAAYSAVLEDLGRADEAATWIGHAERAARALQAHHGSQDELEVFEVYEDEIDDAPEDEVNDAHVSDSDGASESVEPQTDTGAVEEPASSGPAAEQTPGSDDAGAGPSDVAPADEEMSIEDEVDELLAAAGIGTGATSEDAAEAPATGDATAEAETEEGQ